MKIRILRGISLASLSIIGLYSIFGIWEIIEWNELSVKIIVTLIIIFLVSALMLEVLRKDANK